MTAQNKSNHRRFFPPYHFLILPIGIICLCFSLYCLICNLSDTNQRLEYLLLSALSLSLLLTGFFGRVSTLKAQDRAIRAEESLRHYILLGAPIHAELRLSQIIALRFASNEELKTLTEKAVIEKLKSSEIKSLIKNWREDRYRV
jgi:hypothetical protein